MKNHAYHLLVALGCFIFLVSGCSKNNPFSGVTVPGGGNQPTGSGGPSNPPGGPSGPGGSGGSGGGITGSYCTTWTEFARTSTTDPAFEVSCLQNDGTWQMAGGAVDEGASCGTSGVEAYGYPELFMNQSSGTLAVGYERCIGYPNKEIWVRTFDSNSGWVQAGGGIVNSLNSTTAPEMDQFGPSFAWPQNQLTVFWETTGKNVISTSSSGSAWTATQFTDPVDGPTGGDVRHPDFFFADPTNNNGYLFYGDPQPTIWSWNGSAAQELPAFPSPPGDTLYTSLINWNGNLMMAYTAGNNSSTWQGEVVKVQTTTYNANSGWTVNTAPVEQTPGTDPIRPFLFTVGSNLYLMYADYTTDGVPTDPEAIAFHFRVSQWNGSQWMQTGSESPSLVLSQRFEFMQDGDRVLFSAIERMVQGQTAQQVVLAWENGTFSQVGNVVRTYTTPMPLWRARPGAVVKISPQSLNALFAATKNYRQKQATQPTPKVVTLCSPLRGGMAEGHLSPRSNSVVIDFGEAISIPNMPYCQYDDAAPDAGAYEYNLN